MKKAILFLVCAAVAGSAAAQGSKKPAPVAKETKCAVMAKDKVVIADAQKAGLFADYKNKRYYFCCAGCPEAFKKNPAKYAKTAQGFPIPKLGKTKHYDPST